RQNPAVLCPGGPAAPGGAAADQLDRPGPAPAGLQRVWRAVVRVRGEPLARRPRCPPQARHRLGRQLRVARDLRLSPAAGSSRSLLAAADLLSLLCGPGGAVAPLGNCEAPLPNPSPKRGGAICSPSPLRGGDRGEGSWDSLSVLHPPSLAFVPRRA